MTLEIITIPCRSDNYAFLIHNAETGETALVDAPASAPILKELETRGWKLNWILLTHHHDDHVEGVRDLVREHHPQVIGCAADAYRLPPLDHQVLDGDTFNICGHEVEVWDVSGHTIGHVAFIIRDAQAAFTADSLMALGCGRVFEGTFEQMWDSLSKFAVLPDETLIYSGHEYTAANGRFALTVDAGNPTLEARIAEIDEIRGAGGFTVPSTLATERATNPFLRASAPEMKEKLGMENASDSEVFAAIRQRKDQF